MTQALLNPPPISAPLVDPNGRLTMAWSSWFLQGVTPIIQGIPGPSDLVPLMDGDATAGTVTPWARGDHRHPHDDTIPQPSTATPLMDGTGAAGTASPYSREDHRHPSDTSRVSLGGSETITGAKVFTGGLRVPTGLVGAFTGASNGDVAFFTDGRKAGEGPGLGTGTFACFSNGAWRRLSDETVVAA